MSNLVRLELADNTLREQEAHSKKLRQVEIRARASRIVVPTDVQQVRGNLRSLGHPVTLFGEGDAERRDRLRSILAAKAVDGEDVEYINRLRLATGGKKSSGVDALATLSSSSSSSSSSTSENVDSNKKTFYYPAKGNLTQVRQLFAADSFAQVTSRLRTSKRQRTEGAAASTAAVQALYDNVATARVVASQVGGGRSVASVSFSPDDTHIVTGSWDSNCQIWNRASCLPQYMLKGHTERITSVAYCPLVSDNSHTVASGSVDGKAMLWHVDTSNVTMQTNGDDNGNENEAAESQDILEELSPIRVFEGHQDRLGRICWHPRGKHLLTTGFDRTWRLWDVETGDELLTQEGHSRPVYGIAAHCDGALVASTSLSGHGLVWDLRSGQSIMKLMGHAKSVLGCDFSPTGNLLATSSVDGTARLWDLRRHARPLHVIAAHPHLVSSVRFAPISGEYFVTAGYDSMLKMWSTRSGKNITSWTGNEQLCMDVDISKSEDCMVVGGSDRTWKLINVVE
jgi:U4/U6 small nuclear ribonucleoprotein PRP4